MSETDSRKVIKKEKLPRGHLYSLECLYCGKKFTIKGSRFNNGGGKYCSYECYYNYRREIDNTLGRSPQECKVCGKQFKPTSYDHRYCSKDCRLKAQRQRYYENHPDVTPQDGSFVRWKKNRRRALERDNYTCQECGRKNVEEIHVKDNSKSNSPHRETNIDLDNLITLCHKCNIKKHAERGDLNMKDVKNKEYYKERNDRIKQLSKEKSQTEIAREFDLSRQRIHQIINSD